MGAVSSKYQVEYDISDYVKRSYNWGNSSHPETYQSFVTSGEGLIDQSIFSFQRKKDAWSIGAFMTQIACGTDTDNPAMIVSKNRLGKNNVMLVDYIPSTYNHLISDFSINGTDQSGNIKNSYEYSPQVSLGGLAPFINYSYDRFIIIPRFAMKDPSTGNRINSGQLMTIKTIERNSYTNCYVNEISLSYGNYPTGFQYNPVTVQYAGRLIKEKFTTAPGGGYKAEFGDEEYGVYYIPYGNPLFNGFGVNADNVCFGIPGRSYTVPFDLTQMDWRMLMSSDGKKDLCISYADAIKIINSLGFYWGKSDDAIHSERGINCTDPDVVCPVIDPVTHMVTDEVLSGTDIANYAEAHIDDPFCNFLLDYGNRDENDNPIGYTTEEYRENYNPEQPTVEETETIELYPPTVATTGGNTIWLMSETDVKNFFTYLWDPTGSEVTNIIQGLALLGENPMDFIVSIRMFPLKNLYSLTTHALATICFGRYTSQLTNQAYLTSSNIIIVDLGEFYFNDGGLKNDFRDYEPYTRYSLFIPFCGITPLNAVECINQTIDVKMIIDLATGACTAVVYTDGVPYKYIDSNIGLEIPVVGRDMAGYAQTVMAAALGGGLGGGRVAQKPVKGQLERQSLAKDYQQISYDAKMWDVGDSFGATAGAAGGAAVALGAAAVVGGAALLGTAAALANAPSIDKAGASVPAVALAEPLYCYFIVQRSDCWIPQNYEKLYGRPLNEGGKVGDFAGFSTFGSFKLDGISGATPEEKLLINDLLQAGIYI